MTRIRGRAWTLALGAALGAAMAAGPSPAHAQDAELELYGNFRYSINWASAGDDSRWTGANNASRAGVRGALGQEEWSAVYHLEVGASVDGENDAFTPRFYLGGIRGPYGTLTVGRHSPAYKLPALAVDPFYDTSTTSVTAGIPFRGLFAGGSYGLSPMANGWARRAVAYQSPEHRGVTANAALYPDPEGGADYALGFVFEEDRLQAGIDLLDHRSEGRNWPNAAGVDWTVRGHGLYSGEEWTAGISFERVDPVGADSHILLFGSGTLQVTEEARLALAVGNVGSTEGPSAPAGTGFHLGGFYELLAGAEVYALFSAANLDDLPNREVASLGLNVDFGWSP